MKVVIFAGGPGTSISQTFKADKACMLMVELIKCGQLNPWKYNIYPKIAFGNEMEPFFKPTEMEST